MSQGLPSKLASPLGGFGSVSQVEVDKTHQGEHDTAAVHREPLAQLDRLQARKSQLDGEMQAFLADPLPEAEMTQLKDMFQSIEDDILVGIRRLR